MASLTETSQWESGIYQLETTDPVQGGPEGVDNAQAKQLANRTLYLKNLMNNHADSAVTPDPHPQYIQAEALSDDVREIMNTYGPSSPVNEQWNGYLAPEYQEQLPSATGYPNTSSEGGTVYSSGAGISGDENIGVVRSGASSNTVSADSDGWIFSESIYTTYQLELNQLPSVSDVTVFIKDENGTPYWLKHGDTGVTVTVNSSTGVIAATLLNSIFSALGITKVSRFFAITGNGFVPELTADKLWAIYKSYNVNTTALGLNQTWQAAELTDTGATFNDGSVSYRAKGVTYTNSNDYPIAVTINAVRDDNVYAKVTVSGVVAEYNSVNTYDGGAQRLSASAIVPPGSTYVVDYTVGATVTWAELR